jgi:molecular chaperone IbpA
MATRNFTRSFSLARHIEVEEAKMEDGLLKVKIIRNLPKELRPKEIKIT